MERLATCSSSATRSRRPAGSGLRELVRHQYRLARSFVAVCDRVDLPHRRFSHWPMLPMTPALRLGALGERLSGQPVSLRSASRVTPLLGLGLAAWTAGVAAERNAAS